jgi:hypothetical protein
MANLISTTNGNFTSASTWKLVDSTSLNLTLTSGTALTTSYVQSNAFTPGAVTIDGIAIYISSRSSSPTGTFTIGLHAGGVLVSGTEVVVNVSDTSSYFDCSNCLYIRS